MEFDLGRWQANALPIANATCCLVAAKALRMAFDQAHIGGLDGHLII